MEENKGGAISGDGATREDELERFREAWRAEVKRKLASSSADSSRQVVELHPRDRTDQVYWGPATSSAQLDIDLHRVSSNPQPAARAPHDTITAAASTSRAVSLYREAVECEQRGHLDEALALYRRSFKLDSNVDRAYYRFVAQEVLPPQTAPRERPLEDADPVKQPVAEHVGQTNRTTPSLQQIISAFEPRPMIFGPEDERLPNPFETLPDEIILHILVLLALQRDVTTIERFATINIKARLLAADSSIWRVICERTYVPPQVTPDVSTARIASLYGYNYRHTFIHHPRVRLDGCYIAVCHYIRPGQSENAWVAIRHLITYHRLLRLFPDGTVVSLLTNEEKPLADTVHLLKPTIRIKGSQLGTWALDDTKQRLRIRNLRAPDPGGRAALKYEFAMDLMLTSARNMRWNKLEMQWYASVNLDTGEVQDLPIKRERPFYFSKVRSYAI
ncbi:hypothetical protein CALVIDRAFT_559264 [Calocera viscosa TUFC12733]|uniref:F-box protein Hrt3/FBXO9 C-terminal domain-containing protein n=1 Tax=Calocera viscosa (strain TUFC12733) TaxID=1330018 RepID=A0A167S021_CALVF|nr:hypothetical protein CALVIDRAFT_559264 [Calocera viscosa TUFC12733]